MSQEPGNRCWEKKKLKGSNKLFTSPKSFFPLCGPPIQTTTSHTKFSFNRRPSHGWYHRLPKGELPEVGVWSHGVPSFGQASELCFKKVSKVQMTSANHIWCLGYFYEKLVPPHGNLPVMWGWDGTAAQAAPDHTHLAAQVELTGSPPSHRCHSVSPGAAGNRTDVHGAVIGLTVLKVTLHSSVL